MVAEALTRIPARTVPLLYLGTAHIALGLACVLTTWWPRAVAGFFYHSWMVALVHLITLGWITFSIFGAMYIVGPLALRMNMPARRMDYVAYALALVGLIGMVAHFWIEEYNGMAWSAATLAVGALYTTGRIVAAAREAKVPSAVKLHIVLACVNFWLATSMGILIAVDKVAPFLPGYVLSNVFAHAHLAALGWATMMVVGVGYRLLPMVLPSKMPSGPSMYASAILLETGVLGLFGTLVLRSRWAWIAGLCVCAGLAVFAGHVIWMVRHPARKAVGSPRFDVAVGHAACAGVFLIIALVVGLMLLVAPPSARALQAAAAYGVLGLLGFLAQMVVAMEARLLPLATWCWAYAGSGYRLPPPTPHAMSDRVLQTMALAGWIVGVPSVAAGMALESALLVRLGAAALFNAVALTMFNQLQVLAHAHRASRASSWQS